MGLSNAERQKRWRDKRNELAQALIGPPSEIAEEVLHHLGVDQTKKLVRELENRLRNIKADCPACQGTGFAPVHYTTACGMPLGQGKVSCDCSPNPLPGAFDAAERQRRLRQRWEAERRRQRVAARAAAKHTAAAAPASQTSADACGSPPANP
jgi:hypothetical protein